jgi:large subunit ribosomal protein L28
MEVIYMGKVCSICGKGRQVGYSVSHAHNKSKKVWKPNVQKVRSMNNGTTEKVYACTRCIRSGFIAKPLRKTTSPVDAAV